MNKKKVAIALAALLGINTLMVTVGSFSGQTVVQAVMNMEKGMKPMVYNDKDGNVSLSFNMTNIKDVKVSKPFTHTKYKDRETIDGNNTDITSGTWDSKTGKFTLKGKFMEPGIYTGTIEVEYNDGKKENHNITLRKKAQDKLSFTTKIDVGQIHINNLELKHGMKDKKHNIKKEEVMLVNTTNNKVAKVKSESNGNYIFDILDLGKVKEGDKLELRVGYCDHVMTAEISLVKQATPKIEEAFMTNNGINSEVTANLKKSINGNYPNTDYGFSLNTTGSIVNGENIVKMGDETLFTFTQSVSAANDYVGGARITPKVDGTKVDLTFGGGQGINVNVINTPNGGKGNLVPFATVGYGIDGSGKTSNRGFIGDYKFNIGDKTITYYDALKDATPILAGQGTSTDKHFLTFSGNKPQEYDMQNGRFKVESQKVTLDLKDKLEHGYSSYKGTFTVDITEDQKLISELQGKMDGTNKVAPVLIDQENREKAPFFPPKANFPGRVNTSLVVVADVLDGAFLNASFEKISENEGKLILTGENINDAKLNVKNATVTQLANKGKSLVFNVKFSDKLPETIYWNLVAGNNVNLKGSLNTEIVEVGTAEDQGNGGHEGHHGAVGSTSVTIESIKLDNTKPVTIESISYKNKGNVIKETKDQFANVKVTVDGNKVNIDGLVPNKEYEEIVVKYTDDKGQSKTISVKPSMLQTSNNSLAEYVANAYTVAFGRPGDEVGYHFHLNNLMNKKTNLSEFLSNMLVEKEFLNIYKTPESKVEALYGIIAKRNTDAEGRKFWTEEYKKLLSTYKTEAETLKALINKMLDAIK